MRKLFTFCLILLLCASSAYGIPRSDARDTRNDILRQIEALQGIGNGNVWYVDSDASGAATGKSWTDAVVTVEAAVGLASADDTVYISQGHNEAVVSGSWDADKAGMRFIGFGDNANKPRFDFDSIMSSAGVSIGAPNVRFENLRFVVSANKVSTCIDIEATGDGAQIIDCDIGWAEDAAVDEFSVGINVTTAAHDVYIKRLHMEAHGAEAINGIYVGTVSGFVIEDSTITGDYSTACLNNVGASRNIIARRNLFVNGILQGDGGLNAVAAISMADSTGGIFLDNRIACATPTAILMRVADDMIFMNNWITATDGDEFGASLESGWMGTSVSEGITSVSTYIEG
jgi:hypothetical protein